MVTEIPNILKRLSVPRPSSGHLAALSEADRPVAVFSDFDGTIFLQDSGHILFDKFGCGKEKREALDRSIGKTKTFCEASEEMWGSLNVTLARAQEELRNNLVIDPDFIDYFDYLQERNVVFTVISAGIKPLLRAALDAFVGPERSAKINIISNNGTVTESGQWHPHWLHESPLGIDKSLALREWLSGWDTSKSPKPKVVFTGDGVSDLAAANQADILFARQGLALEQYCIDNMIPYIPYMRFKDALHDIKLLLKDNRYHDKKASEKYRHSQLTQLTGGLVPLSFGSNHPVPRRALFGFAPNDDDDDDSSLSSSEEEENLNPRSAPPNRPQTPPEDPYFFSKAPLDRDMSAGSLYKLNTAG